MGRDTKDTLNEAGEDIHDKTEPLSDKIRAAANDLNNKAFGIREEVEDATSGEFIPLFSTHTSLLLLWLAFRKLPGCVCGDHFVTRNDLHHTVLCVFCAARKLQQCTPLLGNPLHALRMKP